MLLISGDCYTTVLRNVGGGGRVVSVSWTRDHLIGQQKGRSAAQRLSSVESRLRGHCDTGHNANGCI